MRSARCSRRLRAGSPMVRAVRAGAVLCRLIARMRRVGMTRVFAGSRLPQSGRACTAVVAEKLAAGAGADAADGDGNTLLHLAVAGKHMGVIKVVHGIMPCVPSGCI